MAKGAQLKQPVGSGCAGCYRKAIDILGFSTYSAFLESYKKDGTGTKGKCEVIDSRLGSVGKPEVHWEAVATTKGAEFDIEVSQTFRGYSESTMKKRLGLTRLTQKSVEGLVEITAPNLAAPAESTSYYLFKPSANQADEDGVDVTIRARTTLKNSTELLACSRNLYPEHGKDRFSKSWDADKSFSGVKQAVKGNKADKTLETFLEEYKGGQAERKKRPEGISVGAVSGPAADEIAVVEETGGDDDATASLDIHKDLTDDFVKLAPKHLSRQGSSIIGPLSATSAAGDEESDEEEDLQTGARLCLFVAQPFIVGSLSLHERQGSHKKMFFYWGSLHSLRRLDRVLEEEADASRRDGWQAEGAKHQGTSGKSGRPRQHGCHATDGDLAVAVLAEGEHG